VCGIRVMEVNSRCTVDSGVGVQVEGSSLAG
jgi:hypothetical protein